jgi:hypothetical protein
MKAHPIMKRKSLIIILATVTALLLVPFVAMQLSAEVSWTVSDFIVMGALLFGTGLLCEVVIRKVAKTSHRIILCAGVLFVFLYVWAELAVGIFF